MKNGSAKQCSVAQVGAFSMTRQLANTLTRTPRMSSHFASAALNLWLSGSSALTFSLPAHFFILTATNLDSTWPKIETSTSRPDKQRRSIPGLDPHLLLSPLLLLPNTQHASFSSSVRRLNNSPTHLVWVSQSNLVRPVLALPLAARN